MGQSDMMDNGKTGLRMYSLIAFVTSFSTVATGYNAAYDLRLLQKEYWAYEMRKAPSTSTYYGMYSYNDIMTSYSINRFDKQLNETYELFESLMDIDREELSARDRVNYDVLADTLETAINGSEWIYYGTLSPITFMSGIQLYDKPNSADSTTRGDFENYILRLQSVQRQVDEIKESCKLAIRMSRALHNVSLAAVPGQIDRQIKEKPEDWSYYDDQFMWKLNYSNVEDETERADIRRRGREATLAYFNAMRDLKNFIINEYIPKTRSEYGVYAWDATDGYYRACLKWHLSVNMSPEEVHELGLAEVDRISKKMNKILKQLKFHGSVRQFFNSLRGDERFYTHNVSEIVEAYQDVYNRIMQRVPTLFSNIPDIPVNIVPGHTLSSYQFATDTTPGAFIVDVRRPEEVPFFEMMALSLHETSPGHHLQHSYAMMADLPEFRRKPNLAYYNIPAASPTYTAYTEGWGLYAEYLGEEMGLYKDRYERMGRYSFEILRAARLVLDTAIHYKSYSWSRAKAVEYLMNYTALTETGARLEVDRYITVPGQACAYKVGEIWIRGLRQMAQQELGHKFNIKEFHHVILKNGMMPLHLLENTVRQWISTMKIATKQISCTATSLPVNIIVRTLVIPVVISSYL